MRETPKRYPLLLSITIALVGLLLGSFGLLGYMTYVYPYLQCL